MSKPVPLQFGHYYHIFNRGNNRENTFIEERNYRYFLRLLAQHTTSVVDVFAYCLLRNHFHMLVRIKTLAEQEETWRETRSQREFKPQNPSQGFGNLFNAYTKAMNKAYNRTGSLFEKPFGRIEVTTDAYFTYLIAYIHRNPQKHDFVEDFRDWPFSSYHSLLSEKETHLQRQQVIAWFDSVEQFEAFHDYEVDTYQISHLVPEDLD